MEPSPLGSIVLIGTGNPAKLARYSELLRQAFSPQPVQVVSPASLEAEVRVVEDGRTAVENARKKARTYAEVSGLPTLAIDEALYIVGLPPEAQPGLQVRRYGGRERSDEEIVDLLLEKIKDIPPWRREAVWTWAYCLALPRTVNYVEEVTVRDGLAVTKRLPIPVGYPLSSLMIDAVTGKRVCDLTRSEAATRLQLAGDAIRRLVTLAFPQVDARNR